MPIRMYGTLGLLRRQIHVQAKQVAAGASCPCDESVELVLNRFQELAKVDLNAHLGVRMPQAGDGVGCDGAGVGCDGGLTDVGCDGARCY
jgi:hypothetical protein